MAEETFRDIPSYMQGFLPPTIPSPEETRKIPELKNPHQSLSFATGGIVGLTGIKADRIEIVEEPPPDGSGSISIRMYLAERVGGVASIHTAASSLLYSDSSFFSKTIRWNTSIEILEDITVMPDWIWTLHGMTALLQMSITSSDDTAKWLKNLKDQYLIKLSDAENRYNNKVARLKEANMLLFSSSGYSQFRLYDIDFRLDPYHKTVAGEYIFVDLGKKTLVKIPAEQKDFREHKSLLKKIEEYLPLETDHISPHIDELPTHRTDWQNEDYIKWQQIRTALRNVCGKAETSEEPQPKEADAIDIFLRTRCHTPEPDWKKATQSWLPYWSEPDFVPSGVNPLKYPPIYCFPHVLENYVARHISSLPNSGKLKIIVQNCLQTKYEEIHGSVIAEDANLHGEGYVYSLPHPDTMAFKKLAERYGDIFSDISAEPLDLESV